MSNNNTNQQHYESEIYDDSDQYNNNNLINNNNNNILLGKTKEELINIIIGLRQQLHESEDYNNNNNNNINNSIINNNNKLEEEHDITPYENHNKTYDTSLININTNTNLNNNNTNTNLNNNNIIIDNNINNNNNNNNKDPYVVSLSVLVIQGNTNNITTIPLVDIISKSYLRKDERDTDTPMEFNNNNLINNNNNLDNNNNNNNNNFENTYERRSITSYFSQERCCSIDNLGRESLLLWQSFSENNIDINNNNSLINNNNNSISDERQDSISREIFSSSDNINDNNINNNNNNNNYYYDDYLDTGGSTSEEGSPIIDRRLIMLNNINNNNNNNNKWWNRPININPLRLSRVENLAVGPDACLTHRTLNTFKETYNNNNNYYLNNNNNYLNNNNNNNNETRAITPQSSSAASVLYYLTEIFTIKNNFTHSSQEDIESLGIMLLSLSKEVNNIFINENRHISVKSPVYVFGDLHGNFRDLIYFMKNMIHFNDLRYTPHRFLFLGDYVDRGEFSVEVVAYLFALKILSPEKIILLRGNHEDTLVSGDISGYGNTSFRAQCRNLFGEISGEEIWKNISKTFAALPLTGNIDNRIFCTHGGIPRYSGGKDNRMDIIKNNNFPKLESFFLIPEDESEEGRVFRQAAMDICWSDPAEDENNSGLDKYGFGANPRGNGVILFGTTAIDEFLNNTGFEIIFRAHQEKSDGLRLSKNSRVFTIFSTSAYVGHQNGGGVVLVTDQKIRLIIKNPPDRND